MNKGKVAWLIRGWYDIPLRDDHDWEIVFEEPSYYVYKEVQKVVIFEIE